MSIGRVLQRAASAVGHNPLVVLAWALAGALPGLLVLQFPHAIVPPTGLRGGLLAPGVLITPGLAWIANTAIGAFVQAGLIRAVAADSDRRRVSVSDCLGAGFRFFLPLAALGVLYLLAIGFGFILLIVPGIVAIVIWSVAGPALVLERSGVFAAFSRSRELTRGSRWKILGLLLLIGGAYLVLEIISGLLGLSMWRTERSGNWVGSASNAKLISTGLSTAVGNLTWRTIRPALFIELREAKEGSGMDSLGEIFA